MDDSVPGYIRRSEEPEKDTVWPKLDPLTDEWVNEDGTRTPRSLNAHSSEQARVKER